MLNPDRLLEQRIKAGLSQDELSELSGVARATVQELEAGSRTAWPRTVRKLAEALGVAPSDLYSDVRGTLAAERAAEDATPKAEVQLTAEQLGVPEGSPDPRFWGSDEDRPNPAAEGIPGPSGRRINVEITEGQAGGTRVSITYQSFLEVMRQVRRGELSPEEAIEKLVAA